MPTSSADGLPASVSAEDSLIAGLVGRLPAERQFPKVRLGTGDDSAVIVASDGRVTVSTDILIQDVHFRRAWSTAFDLGWRLAAQNLADCAAMGALPTAVVVALAAPDDLLEPDWLGLFADGLAAICRPWTTAVVGGDLSSAAAIALCGTILGDLEGRAAVTRAGARPGDVLALHDAAPNSPLDPCVPLPGVLRLGGSAAGLAYLNWAWETVGPDAEGLGRQQRQSGAGLAELAAAAVAAYLRPNPAISQGKKAANAGATAMIDISDGLVMDAGRLARASAVRIDIDRLAPALVQAADRWRPLAELLDADAWAWVLSGGEDHALLATFPQVDALPEGWQVIGQVVQASQDGSLVTGAGCWPGWDHVRR
jgi:thiamine-monophosphate kinase